MPSIPRDWQFSGVGAGGAQVSIVIPASGPNIRHILTSITAKMYSVGGGAGAFSLAVQVSDGATVLHTWILLLNAANIEADTYEDEVLLVGSPATPMLVQFTAGSPATIGQILRIKGYDQ